MFGFRFFEVLEKRSYDVSTEYRYKDYIDKLKNGEIISGFLPKLMDKLGYFGFGLTSFENSNVFFSQKKFYKQLLNLNSSFFSKNLFEGSFFNFFSNLNNLKKKQYISIKRHKQFRYNSYLLKKKDDVLFLKGSFFFNRRKYPKKRNRKFFFFRSKIKKFNKYFFFLFENFSLFKRVLFIDKLNLENSYFRFLKVSSLQNLVFNGLHFSRLFFKYIQKFSRQKFFKFRRSRRKYFYYFQNYLNYNRKKIFISQEYLTTLLGNDSMENIKFNLKNSWKNFIQGYGNYHLDNKVKFLFNDEGSENESFPIFLKQEKEKKNYALKRPYRKRYKFRRKFFGFNKRIVKSLKSVKKKFIHFIESKSLLEKRNIFNKKKGARYFVKNIFNNFKDKFKKIKLDIHNNNHVDFGENLKKKLDDIFFGKKKKKLFNILKKKMKKLIYIHQKKKEADYAKLMMNPKKIVYKGVFKNKEKEIDLNFDLIKTIQSKYLFYPLYYSIFFKFRRYHNYLKLNVKKFIFDNFKSKMKKKHFKKFKKIKNFFKKYYNDFLFKKDNSITFYNNEKKYIEFLRLFFNGIYKISRKLYKKKLFSDHIEYKKIFSLKKYKLNRESHRLFKNSKPYFFYMETEEYGNFMKFGIRKKGFMKDKSFVKVYKRRLRFCFKLKKKKKILKNKKLKKKKKILKNKKINKKKKKKDVLKKIFKKIIRKIILKTLGGKMKESVKKEIKRKNIGKRNILRELRKKKYLLKENILKKLKYHQYKKKRIFWISNDVSKINTKYNRKIIKYKIINKFKIKNINKKTNKQSKNQDKNKKLPKHLKKRYFKLKSIDFRINQFKLKIKDKLSNNVVLIKHLKNQLKARLILFNSLKKSFIKEKDNINLSNKIEKVLFSIRFLKLKLKEELKFHLILKKGLVLVVILKRICRGSSKKFFDDFFGESIKKLINEDFYFLESLENFLNVGFCKEIFKNNMGNTLRRIYGKTNLLYKFYNRYIKRSNVFYFLRNNKKIYFDKKKEYFDNDDDWVAKCIKKKKKFSRRGIYNITSLLKFPSKTYISYLKKKLGYFRRRKLKRRFYKIKFLNILYLNLKKKKKFFKKINSNVGLRRREWNLIDRRSIKIKNKKRSRILMFLKKGLFPNNISFFNFQLFLFLWKKFNIYFFFKTFFFKFFFLFYCRKLLLNSLTEISNSFFKLKLKFLILKNYLVFIFFKQINFIKVNLLKKNNIFFNFFLKCNFLLKEKNEKKRNMFGSDFKYKKVFNFLKKIKLKNKWLIFKSNIKFLLMKTLRGSEFLRKFKIKNFYLKKKRYIIKNVKRVLKVFSKSKTKMVIFKSKIKNFRFKFNNKIERFLDYKKCNNKFRKYSNLFFENNIKIFNYKNENNWYKILKGFNTYFSFSKITNLVMSKINKIQNKDSFYGFDLKFLIKKICYLVKSKFFSFRFFFRAKSRLVLSNINFFYNLICNILFSNLFYFFKNFLNKIGFYFNFLKMKVVSGINMILIFFFNKLLKMDFLSLFYSVKYFIKNNFNLRDRLLFKLKNNNNKNLLYKDNLYNMKNIMKYKFMKFFEKNKQKKLYSKNQKITTVNVLRKKTNKIINKNKVQFNVKDFENEKISMFNSKKLLKTFKKIFYIIMSRSFNNVFISIIKRNGKLLIKSSNGMLGFKGPTRLTEMASKENVKELAKKILFKFKGFTKFRMEEIYKKPHFNIRFFNNKNNLKFNNKNNLKFNNKYNLKFKNKYNNNFLNNTDNLKKKLKLKPLKYDINFLKKTKLKNLFNSSNIKELNLKFKELNKAFRYKIKLNKYGKYFFYDRKKSLKISLKKVMNSVKRQDTKLNFFVFVKGYFFKRSVKSAIYHLRFFFENRDLKILRVVSMIKKPFNGCRMKKIRRA